MSWLTEPVVRAEVREMVSATGSLDAVLTTDKRGCRTKGRRRSRGGIARTAEAREEADSSLAVAAAQVKVIQLSIDCAARNLSIFRAASSGQHLPGSIFLHQLRAPASGRLGRGWR